MEIYQWHLPFQHRVIECGLEMRENAVDYVAFRTLHRIKMAKKKLNEKNPDDRETEKGVNEPELSSQKVCLTA